MRMTRRIQEYDYIIVGGGSAGCVLASRLTEDPERRVLLLEAGPPDRHWRIAMPAAVGSLLSSDTFNWNYVSEPEPHLGGRRLTHPRGRVLGGSSSINGMVYIRGHARDYDGWAAAGLAGWSYAEVLPYFKRAERRLAGGDAYRGNRGPLQVFTPTPSEQPLSEAFLGAARAIGYQLTSDVNGMRQEGFGAIDRTTTAHGRRCSAARAYLRPAARRPNLRIQTDALVHRIIFNGHRAVAVEYSSGGDILRPHAAAEVLLAAGAFNSPQVLQRSGIGPGGALQGAGIKPLRHLPAVGTHLNDHPDIVIQHAAANGGSIYPHTRGIPRLVAGLKWFAGLDTIASSNHFEAGGFIRSRAGIEFPDLQLTFMPLAIKPGTVESVGRHSFQVHIDLMRPRSEGIVRVRSADPTAAPAICFNYFRDPQDLADMRTSVGLVREIVAAAPMAGHSAGEINPGPAITSDTDLDDWIKRTVETCYHPVSTCRMGATDADAVVDGEGRVFGLEALRVVDASIMPSIVSGNTNAPTIMIAEKISDHIRGRPMLPPEAEPAWIHPEWRTSQR